MGDGVRQSAGCIGLIGDGSSVMAGRLTLRKSTSADDSPIPPDLWAWQKLDQVPVVRTLTWTYH